MKKVLKIKYCSYARNSEHFQLYSFLLADFTEELARKHKLMQYWDAFRCSLERENNAYLQNQAYKETIQINKKNETCERLFRSFYLLIQSKKLGFDDEERKEADKLLYLLKPYSGASYKPHAEHIAMIKDLVNELESESYASTVEKLGLSKYVAELKNAMLEFESAYRKRSEEKLERSTINRMKIIRPVVEKTFDELSEVISVCYIMAAYIEKDMEKAMELEEVIDHLNSAINEFHSIILRRLRSARAKTRINDDEPLEEVETDY